MEGSESPEFRESVTRLSSGPRPWTIIEFPDYTYESRPWTIIEFPDYTYESWNYYAETSVTNNTLDKPSNT